MSRLLIRNLPANASSDSLRTHLSSVKHLSPVITDVHVARKADGTPRRFAFVGFKTEGQATAIKEYFDKTYWGSQKIAVEIVQGVKDAPAPRPNKRPRGERIKNDKKDSSIASFLRPEDTADKPANEPISDMDWLKSRMHRGIPDAETKAFEQSDDDDKILDEQKELPEKDLSVTSAPLDPKESTKQTILSTRRLFVRNLTFTCVNDEVKELFGKYGAIEQVHIPLQADHTSKGLAFVLFANSEDAVSAWEALDGTTFQGRLLHILAGVERRTGRSDAIPSKNLKEDRAEKRKKNSGKDFNWAMLYMNSDAVASSIAERLNILKADLLGASGDDGTGSQNPAVKLALAETHIIQETKRYFESQGVVLETFVRQSVPRSRNIILVKNIPYGTTSDTLKEIFDPHGSISRLLMPPSGTLALVEYEHPEEAARAFRAAAYKRLGNSIVYLEWAPEGILSDNTSTPKATAALPTVSKPVTIREQIGLEEEQASVRSGNTIYVKNLSFKTTSERLVEVFGKLPAFVFARVQMKPAPANQKGGQQDKLSMGYGFVGFADKESAQKALTSMQGFILDGHKLYVSFAGRGADEEERKETQVPKTKTPKMIVKNVPFEATKKDIRDLFGVYGTLKSVRLPKKFDKRSRGFAFLEFVSRQEAENAYGALRHTHLLGRHLVLDWAAEGDRDIDELRRKTDIGFGGGNEVPSRKRKLEMALDDEDAEEEG